MLGRPVVVSQSGIVICCVLTVFWVTSCLPSQWRHKYRVCSSDSPMGSTDLTL